MADFKFFYVATDTPYPLAATLRVCDNPKGVILINAGTCIKRSFYDEIAIYFSHGGYITVQYDYVGVGESRPTDLRKANRSIHDWGAKDMQTMSEWIDDQYPELNKYIIGHSMGGQIVGLMPSINSFTKVITIASSYGNVRNFDSTIRTWGMLISLNSVFPLLNKIYGYFPAYMLGMGMDWPHDIAEDWRKWNTQYLSLREWMDRLDKQHFFADLRVPMVSYVLADDPMATRKCVPHFKIDYPDTDIRIVDPMDYGLEELGHFKTFKATALPFWKELLEELDA